ncbi:MAG: AgmX/PglI C-terminal domain-containing protein [Oligoflexia bacterium]|nr:AgmX/PglI C-terminal domain-containing protein [Oligoflexia bacterium]
MGNRKIQNIIAIILILLGLLGLLFQEQMWDFWQRIKIANDPRPTLAHVVSLNGNVKFRLPESLTYFKARSEMPLRAKDTIATDPSSTAIIEFKTGLKVELEPNSLIVIEDYGSGSGSLELTFLQGGIRVLNEGKGQKLNLSGDRLKRDQAVKLDLSAIENAARATPTPGLDTIKLDEKAEQERRRKARKKDAKESLPDSYITSIIKGQRTFLNRCYAQHLRLNPDARGRIDTSLTIEPDGSISTARVIGSTIADPSLQQCVVTTLLRTRFRSFKGDPIIVNYPINFE